MRLPVLPVLLVLSVAGPVAPTAESTARQTAATSTSAAKFELSVDSIMRGPKLVGYPPSDLRWSGDSTRLYFEWRQPEEDRPDTWVVGHDGKGLRKLSEDERRLAPPPDAVWDRAHRRALFVDEGDIALVDTIKGTRVDITRTSIPEGNPRWARGETHVTFTREDSLFLVPVTGRSGGLVIQVMEGMPKEREPQLTKSQEYLEQEEAKLLEHVRESARKKKEAEERRERREPPRLELGERQSMVDAALDSSERYAYVLVSERPASAKPANVPEYLTESAYTDEIHARTKVGDAQDTRRLAVLDLEARQATWVLWPVAPPEQTRLEQDQTADETLTDAAPTGRGHGASEDVAQDNRETGVPENSAEKPAAAATDGTARSRPSVNWLDLKLSHDGRQAVAVVRSSDNKDRWIVRIAPQTGATTVLDHERDDAWLRRDGDANWLPDNRHLYFVAERDGWRHLYVVDATAENPVPKALTAGRWEVDEVTLAKDGARFFISSTEADPGERQVYAVPTTGGAASRLTSAPGRYTIAPSPDGATAGLVYSAGNKPPEVYLMPLDGSNADSRVIQVTTSTSPEWRSFPWLDPKLVTFQARDGAAVRARLFTPEMLRATRDPKRPGVIFIHGAGYLQNAHRYWSTYYREYMFHHLLASRGYVVLDIDYRGSAGYGRDWRTAIYRHMGGKDLDDIVDGAKYLVAQEGVDAKRLGVYGGSYGGFLTLMAMFTQPEVFAAGAALRPVTDWAHYNHSYTSNILNIPQEDAKAYQRSSPIYFAEGLEGALLICHGMVDTNVHFQDSVRLAQRLIELRKQNWELAGYPAESHAFEEETSWADEYRRILKLFEEHLK
ncbi:MAG: prolyl oligopeptidase family serine peptidase [Luteitalea sp.]|nr:prolyl oligopeptidase family serine peptidase [Luteitalea sp.]